MQNVSLLFRSSVFAADYLHQVCAGISCNQTLSSSSGKKKSHNETLRNANDAKKQTHFEMLTETLFWLVYVNSNDPLRLSILLKLHHVNPS